jgi:hypothetical protein
MHHPLDPRRSEIRLLPILPDSVDSHIRVCLEIYTPLTDEYQAQIKDCDTMSQWKPAPIRFKMPYYETLSYEWGVIIGPKYGVLLGGEPFYVRKNFFYNTLYLGMSILAYASI